ncbi:hypothetical protein V6N11_073204 [Hibiscus sabdariffa]|uniref:Uncharacterized protein n=1 Tax=Hibiscus sabdariffa TaxID=183260 RepID=A0ABR2A5R9_9ROSI
MEEGRILAAGEAVEGEVGKLIEVDTERVRGKAENKAEKNIEVVKMANVQRARRSFQEHSSNIERVRTKVSFSDDSDRPWDRKWKSAKEESDDLKDVQSFSDVNSTKRGTVGEDRCSSGTEVDAIKAMYAEREYDDYFHREKNGLGNRSIEEEGLGGSSKEETTDYGNRNEERNKENGTKNVLGAEIEKEGCNVVSPRIIEIGSGLLDSNIAREPSRAEEPKPAVKLNKSGEEPHEETHESWASRLLNSGEKVLVSELEKVGDVVRTQKKIQLGPENLIDNMVEALDLARCGHNPKEAALQFKIDKASSELWQQAWANRVNEHLNVGKGTATSKEEVVQKEGENEIYFFAKLEEKKSRKRRRKNKKVGSLLEM